VTQALGGGNANAGAVFRVGDRVHRPTGAHSPLMRAALEHLEHVGFGGAPRWVGADDEGRDVVSFVPGETHPGELPEWLVEPSTVAAVAALVRRLHDSLADFAPPEGAVVRLPAPPLLAGDGWCHGDIGFGPRRVGGL